MATLSNLVFRVQRQYVKLGQNPPPKPDIRHDIADAIRLVQDEVVLDAMKELLVYHPTDMLGERIIIPPARFGRYVNFKAEESDGELGRPYGELITRGMFDDIKRREGDSEFDSTATRIITIGEVVDQASPTSIFEIYPTSVSGREMWLTFIQASSVIGTITLPARLHLMVIYHASGQQNKFETELARINRNWFNLHGLTPASVGITGMIGGNY